MRKWFFHDAVKQIVLLKSAQYFAWPHRKRNRKIVLEQYFYTRYLTEQEHRLLLQAGNTQLPQPPNLPYFEITNANSECVLNIISRLQYMSKPR